MPVFGHTLVAATSFIPEATLAVGIDAERQETHWPDAMLPSPAKAPRANIGETTGDLGAAVDRAREQAAAAAKAAFAARATAAAGLASQRRGPSAVEATDANAAASMRAAVVEQKIRRLERELEAVQASRASATSEARAALEATDLPAASRRLRRLEADLDETDRSLSRVERAQRALGSELSGHRRGSHMLSEVARG